MTAPLTHSPEVSDALAAGRPVVALESTIITHGMPWPQNLEMARQVEQVIRDNGAVPATIAVMDGQIHVGLTDDALQALARTPSDQAMKLSRADLAVCLANGRTGATTVAATMICAHLAGIRVFATGGIGGVHRGAESSFDISADLQELAQTPVTVVNPIPPEAEIARDQIMPVIEQALSEAEAQGVAAKEVTPFLLQRIFELTGGRSLQSNIALVLNNARLASQIAIAMTR